MIKVVPLSSVPSSALLCCIEPLSGAMGFALRVACSALRARCRETRISRCSALFDVIRRLLRALSAARSVFLCSAVSDAIRSLLRALRLADLPALPTSRTQNVAFDGID